jgi:hypothetical protein
MDYLHTPRNTPEFDKWNCFVDKFESMSKRIQKLILKNLHGGVKIWCIELCALIIDTTKLTKYRRWLPMLVCFLTLAKINKIVATHYEVEFQGRHEYIKPNINALIENGCLVICFGQLDFQGLDM